MVRGQQTWKFGVDFLQQRLKTIPMFGASGGRYEFNRNTTLTNSALTNGTGGTAFAQFLLGIYNQATLRDSLIPYYYQWNSCGRLRSERLAGASEPDAQSGPALHAAAARAPKATIARARSGRIWPRSFRWPSQ